MSEQALKGIVWNLERTVRKLEWSLPKTAWRDYYEEAGHYSEAAAEHKKEIVGRFLDEAGGRSVWDLGGNVGVFSRIAAEKGSNVVCFDIDPGCVEMNYRKVKEGAETGVLPLLSDLRNPVPALGWANRERAAFAERGPADVAMALALIHHLAIGNNVPLDMVAEFFSELGNRLIIEFVPKSDPMVQTLLANREDIFPDYDQPGFERAFGARFEIERSEGVKDTDRVMYLLRRK
jgi:ribosomal protein L11 methylase PrmA